jgi:hypothetical protein
MTERSLLQRPARLALCFVTLVAALAGAALVTAAPAAALSPGCTLVNTFQGLQPASMSAPNTFEAGERLTWQAGPPTSGGTPTGMLMTVTPFPGGTTTSLSTPFPGTLVYDFTVTDFYVVQLVTSLTGLFPASTWTVTCGPPPPVVPGTPATPPLIPAREFGIPHVILCSPTLAMRANGTMGHAFDVEFRAWKANASYIPAGAVPARYYEGVGLDCSNLPGYTDAGRKTDGLGTDFGSAAPAIEGAVYPYFKKS